MIIFQIKIVYDTILQINRMERTVLLKDLKILAEYRSKKWFCWTIKI